MGVVNTLAFFDFSKNPIMGKYRSLIFDLKDGLVLTKQSTRSISNTLYHYVLVGGQFYQKSTSKSLKHKYMNVISTGTGAFFSLKGHSTSNTDWIALHFLKDYHYSKNKISFTTVSLGGLKLKFTYHDIKRHILDRLRESLHHNLQVRSTLFSHIELLGISYSPLPATAKSLIYQCDLINPNFKPEPEPMPSLVEKHCDLYISRAIQCGEQTLDSYTFKEIKRIRYNN